jgi:8-oxo-dGTP diphosphatase
MTKQRHVVIPASYLILTKNNKILLLKRFNTGYEDGNYSLIAGHVENGETFTDTIIREAEEEAGIIVQRKNLKVVHIMHRKSHSGPKNERVDVFFTTKAWSGKIINKEPRKCEELAWFDLNNLPSNTIKYVKHVLAEVSNNNFYSEQD